MKLNFSLAARPGSIQSARPWSVRGFIIKFDSRQNALKTML